MIFLRLFHRAIIRDLRRSPAQAALTIAGIALGIAVVVAVQLANDRAIGSFNDSLTTMAGTADLQVSANGLPLPEKLIPELAWLWDYGKISPVIEGRGVLDHDPVQIFGFDLIARGGLGTSDTTLDLQQAIVTASLAQKHGLRVGSSMDLLLGDRKETFVVGAILSGDGMAKAFSGNVVFFDIAAAQLALRKIGVVDRIDIELHPGTDREAIRKRIAASLPATAAVDVPEAASLQSEKLLRAFRYNLTALSYVSLIVGVILVYNTLTIAAIRRRSEIGMLRTLGCSRGTIAALFLAEAALLGLIGSAIGLVFGEVLARASGVMVTRTIESLYTGVFALPATGAAQLSFYATVVGLGVLLSVASGLRPALGATTVSPVSVMRQGIAVAERPKRRKIAATAGMAVLTLADFVARRPAWHGFPFFGYAAALLLIIGFGLLAPLFSHYVVQLLSGPLRAVSPVEGSLAAQGMRANQGRIVTAVLSLAIAVAMLVSVVTMVSSFRETVIVWVNQTLRADLYVRAAASGPNDWNNPFEPKTIETLGQLPGIAAIDRFRGRALTLAGNPVVLGAGEFRVMSRYSDLLFMDGRSAASFVDRIIDSNRVIVSEPFAIKLGLKKGDTVTLPTAEGAVPFEIENVYYDYSNDRGTVVMDRSTYLRLFHDTSVTDIAVYMKPGVDASIGQQEIAKALPDAQLRVLANADLKQQVLRVFDQTFQVTYALESIALLVAILGIANTLAALILERRPEFAMLRFVGVDRRQLRKLVMIESGTVGLIGAALGFVLGVGLALILVFVINKQSFGWTIQFVLPGWFVAQSLGMIFLATIVAGIYPARMATRMDAIRGIRAE